MHQSSFANTKYNNMTYRNLKNLSNWKLRKNKLISCSFESQLVEIQIRTVLMSQERNKKSCMGTLRTTLDPWVLENKNF